VSHLKEDVFVCESGCLFGLQHALLLVPGLFVDAPAPFQVLVAALVRVEAASGAPEVALVAVDWARQLGRLEQSGTAGFGGLLFIGRCFSLGTRPPRLCASRRSNSKRQTVRVKAVSECHFEVYHQIF
jgi:hypothetical protein